MSLHFRLNLHLTTGKRGAISIFAATAGGQLLALMLAPILSRIYSPSDFGVLTVVTALAATLSAGAALRLELAVPLPRDDRDVERLVAVGLLAIGVLSTVATIALALSGHWVAALFNEPSLRPWLTLAAPMAAVMATIALLNQLAIRHQRYNLVARRSMLSSVVSPLGQAIGGMAGLRPGGLILGAITGQCLATMSLLSGSALHIGSIRRNLSLRSVRDLLSRYRRFPLLSTPAGILNALGMYAPSVLIAYFYGSSVVGWFGLAQRVVAVPITLVGITLAQVYMGALSRELRSGSNRNVARLFTRASARLVVLATVGVAATLAFAPTGFGLVFGDEWTSSGEYARALALALGTQLICTPLSQTLTALGYQGRQLAWDSARLTLTSTALATCALLGCPAVTAMWTLGAVLAACYAVLWWMSYIAATEDRHEPRHRLDTDI